jgi:hypothetical protein
MEIKPCPFCTSHDLTIQTETKDREGVPSRIHCVDCGAGGPWEYMCPEALEIFFRDGGFPTKLVNLWNDRK